MASVRMTKASPLLLTSFGSFPGVPVNPTEELVAQLATHFSRRHVRAEKLRVEYTFCRNWVRDLDLGAHKTILHLGVAPGAREIRLEQKAHNQAMPEAPDGAGKTWGRDVIIRGSPAVHATRINCQALRRRIPARMREHVVLSEDPGRYLCNFLYYMTLHAAAASGRDVHSLFIHVPSADGEEGMPLEKQVGILSAIIDALGRAGKGWN